MTGSRSAAFHRARAALDDLLSGCGLEAAPLVVAYSGGPDSTLLLAVAADRGPRRRVRALHVDHGWHPDAPAWGEHCRRTARALGVACRVQSVDARARTGEGAEAAARNARYDALRAALRTGEVLLTAHHADDQAETVLFALLRGGGVRGLAGMPAVRRFGAGWHLRPLLGITRQDVLLAVHEQALPSLDDPANRDARHDRVFLREQVLPLLRRRWPQVDRGLVRSGELAADSLTLEDTLAARDYVECRGRIRSRTGSATLDAAALTLLPGARQRALLRWWLRREGLAPAPARRLESALTQIRTARPGRNPRITWPGGEIRRWNGQVWALRPRPEPVPGEVTVWADRQRPLDLAEGRLWPEDLAPLLADIGQVACVHLVRRRGGERVVPAGDGRRRALTTVLRELGLPPWEREAALIIECDGHPVGVFAGGHVLPLAGP